MVLDTNREDVYRVEVSGWDADENFFVEKTKLEWKPENNKAILLRSAIRPGCVLFVRLLQPTGPGASYPIAYAALTSDAKDENGSARISLERLRPRASYKETYKAQNEAVTVA
jgi:hypothetical protein